MSKTAVRENRANLYNADLLIDNAFGYGDFPSHNPFTCFQLFGQMATSL